MTNPIDRIASIVLQEAFNGDPYLPTPEGLPLRLRPGSEHRFAVGDTVMYAPGINSRPREAVIVRLTDERGLVHYVIRELVSGRVVNGVDSWSVRELTDSNWKAQQRSRGEYETMAEPQSAAQEINRTHGMRSRLGESQATDRITSIVLKESLGITGDTPEQRCPDCDRSVDAGNGTPNREVVVSGRRPRGKPGWHNYEPAETVIARMEDNGSGIGEFPATVRYHDETYRWPVIMDSASDQYVFAKYTLYK